jgi:hypothetical protein
LHEIGSHARRGLAALVPLALVAVVVLARPVTGVAHDGSRHDQCVAASGSGYESGSGDDCPVPAAVAAPAPALPAPAALPTPPVTTATAAPLRAVPVPGPAAMPDAPAAGTDPRSSLVAGAALAGLAALVVSGFLARRRLRQGWDEGASDPGAP